MMDDLTKSHDDDNDDETESTPPLIQLDSDTEDENQDEDKNLATTARPSRKCRNLKDKENSEEIVEKKRSHSEEKPKRKYKKRKTDDFVDISEVIHFLC